ncbi:DUF6359 domain-containing protein [Helcococcus kunzii]|uniref:DUF6359 domain-containing protein n=1 Tax=Helcococcus kunzii TaxID=40091 RepID=UPI0038AD90E1
MKGIYKRSLSLLLALAIIFPFFGNVATSLAGTGVANDPYSVSEFQSEYKDGTETVVEGYIVGYRTGTTSMSKTANDDKNIVIAESADETDINKTVPIKLTSGSQLRPKLGLVTNPDLLGKKVSITGKSIKYYGSLGLEASDMKLLEDSNPGETSRETKEENIPEINAGLSIYVADDGKWSDKIYEHSSEDLRLNNDSEDAYTLSQNGEVVYKHHPIYTDKTGILFSDVKHGEYTVKLTLPEGYTIDDRTFNSEKVTKSEDGDFNIKVDGKTFYQFYSIYINKDTSIEREKIKFTFDANGGQFSDSTSEKVSVFEKNTKYSLPENPTREGYRIGGWYTPEGKFINVSTIQNLTEDTVLTFRWIKQYTISYENNIAEADGVKTIQPKKVDANTNYTLPKPYPASTENYEFMGWDLDGDGNVDKQAGETIKITADTTLNYVWKDLNAPEEYTLTIDASEEGVTIDEAKKVVEADENGKLTLPYAFESKLAKEGYSLKGYEVVEGTVLVDGKEVTELTQYQRNITISSDVVLKPIFETTKGQLQLIIKGENGNVQRETLKVVAVGEDGTEYPFTSKSYSGNDATWKTAEEALESGKYTIKITGLDGKEVDTLEPFGHSEVQLNTTSKVNEDGTITIETKFIDDKPYNSFARFYVNLKESEYTLTYKLNKEVQGVTAPEAVKAAKGTEVTLPELPREQRITDSYSFLGYDTNGDGKTDAQAGDKVVLDSNKEVVLIYEGNYGKLNFTFHTDEFKGDTWQTGRVTKLEDLTGFEVVVKDSAGKVIENVETTAKGEIRFNKLPADAYTFEIKLPENYKLVKIADANASAITDYETIVEFEGNTIKLPFLGDNLSLGKSLYVQVEEVVKHTLTIDASEEGVTIDEAKKVVEADENGKLTLPYAFESKLAKEGYSLKGYEVVEGTVLVDGKEVTELTQYQRNITISSDVVLKPIFETTKGQLQLIIKGENGNVQRETLKVVAVGEDGTEYPFTSKSYSGNDATWKTAEEALESGKYTIKITGLDGKEVDTLEPFGHSEVQLNTTSKVNEDGTITIETKFIDDKPYNSFARFYVNLKESEYTLTYKLNKEVQGVTAPEAVKAAKGTEVTLPELPREQRITDSYSFLGYDTNGDGKTDAQAGDKVVLDSNKEVVLIYEGNYGKLNFTFHTDEFKGDTWKTGRVTRIEDLTGFEIVVKDSAGKVIENVETTAKGEIRFNKLPADAYTFEIKLPENYKLVKVADANASSSTDYQTIVEFEGNTIKLPFLGDNLSLGKSLYVQVEEVEKKFGWDQNGDNWNYYDKDGSQVKSAWRWAPILDKDGQPTGKYNWKYFDSKGNNIAQIYTENGSSWLSQAGPTTQYYRGWWTNTENNSEYFFRLSSGSMVTGRQYIDGHWMYFRKSGTVALGWQFFDGHWNFSDRKTGYQAVSEWKWAPILDENGQETGKYNWKYFNGNGHSIDQIYTENGVSWLSQAGPTKQYHRGWWTNPANGAKYFFRLTSGTMVKGEQFIDGAWRFFRKSGTMATGWQKVDGSWKFYRIGTGTRVTGRQFIDGKWYDFDQSGAVKGSRY